MYIDILKVGFVTLASLSGATCARYTMRATKSCCAGFCIEVLGFGLSSLIAYRKPILDAIIEKQYMKMGCIAMSTTSFFLIAEISCGVIYGNTRILNGNISRWCSGFFTDEFVNKSYLPLLFGPKKKGVDYVSWNFLGSLLSPKEVGIITAAVTANTLACNSIASRF